MNLKHVWRVHSTEDGQRYKGCRSSGKYKAGTLGAGDGAAPIGM